MPSKLFLPRKVDPASAVSEVAGLMGPLGLPAAIGGVLGKVAKLTPDDLALAHELLGKPIRLGRKLLRLSSGDPAKNTAILHTAEGERVNTPLTEFLKAWRTIGEETADQFPEGAVVTARGVAAPKATIGARGGMKPRQLK